LLPCRPDGPDLAQSSGDDLPGGIVGRLPRPTLENELDSQAVLAGSLISEVRRLSGLQDLGGCRDQMPAPIAVELAGVWRFRFATAYLYRTANPTIRRCTRSPGRKSKPSTSSRMMVAALPRHVPEASCSAAMMALPRFSTPGNVSA
jgi:hypothetical protein